MVVRVSAINCNLCLLQVEVCQYELCSGSMHVVSSVAVAVRSDSGEMVVVELCVHVVPMQYDRIFLEKNEQKC